uniref:Uncharacterized protein n=1 Tax=Anopheles melas TaxID=34690 RepID=A0A182TVT8_9DIPT
MPLVPWAHAYDWFGLVVLTACWQSFFTEPNGFDWIGSRTLYISAKCRLALTLTVTKTGSNPKRATRPFLAGLGQAPRKQGSSSQARYAHGRGLGKSLQDCNFVTQRVLGEQNVLMLLVMSRENQPALHCGIAPWPEELKKPSEEAMQEASVL